MTTTFTGLGGAPWFNAMHFPGSGSTDAAAAAIAVSNFWEAVDGDIIVGVNWARSGEVEEFDPVDGSLTAVHTTDGVGGAGEASGTALPFSNQALIRWRTGVFSDGREIRGRTYVPGLTLFAVTGGLVSAAVQTNLGNAAGSLADLLGVWRRPRAADPDHEPPITARDGEIVPVAASSVWNQFAILRSRRD